jgi:PadR family transcriptional regulator PadR
MSKIGQQLKKGALEILVLRTIERSDVYGYELIKDMEQRSDGYFSLKEGSLYPILYRLEDKGFIESYKKNFEGERKVPRKYYKITTLGLDALTEMTDAWSEFHKQMNAML